LTVILLDKIKNYSVYDSIPVSFILQSDL